MGGGQSSPGDGYEERLGPLSGERAGPPRTTEDGSWVLARIPLPSFLLLPVTASATGLDCRDSADSRIHRGH